MSFIITNIFVSKWLNAMMEINQQPSQLTTTSRHATQNRLFVWKLTENGLIFSQGSK